MFKMATCSKILLSAGQNLFRTNGLLRKTVPNNGNFSGVIKRMSHGHAEAMVTEPTRWQWHKTKDWFHFYFFVGAIPLGLMTFYCNVFIGPATLEPIPEGYVPKYWEYYRSPITRFFQRYFCQMPQQVYEQSLCHIVRQEERRQIKILRQRIRQYSKQTPDFPIYTFVRDLHAHNVTTYRQLLDKAE